MGLDLRDLKQHDYQCCTGEGREGKLDTELCNGLSFSASYAAFFRVGLLHPMLLATMPPSITDFIHLYQSDLKIAVENVGWHQPAIYIGDG